MGESNDSFFNDILLENIEEIPINFSLLTTLVKYTPSISKTSTFSKLENYIDENYDKAAKIQLKQAILREVKQQLPTETKERGHFVNFFEFFTVKFFQLKVKLAFSGRN